MGDDGFLKALAEIEADNSADDLLPSFGAKEGEAITPKMVEIVKLLQKNLLLVEPTLKWIRETEARMTQAQLTVLYTKEELDEMKKALEE
jgi:hypothetical protein